MADDRLRVGVIGANADRSWAANSHLPALQKLPDFELAAVCTTREESARESAERFGARLAFDDYREMLDRDDIDAVAVSVRVPSHYEPTMAAIEAGKHVYTEWPLGANLDEAKEMASFARAKGVKTMVGLQERRAPLYLRLKELVDEGYFGELLSCMVVWSGSGILDRSSDQRWRADDASGANTLTIGFGHTVDPVCLALGDFTEVSAISRPQVPQWVESDTGELVDVTAPDTVMMCGTTSSGAAVSGVSLAVPWHGTGFQLEIYGRKATAIISTSENDVLGAQRLMVGASGGELEEAPIPERLSLVPEWETRNDAYFIGQMWRHFAAAIREDRRPEPDFDHAVDRHRLLDAIVRASETGKRQAV